MSLSNERFSQKHVLVTGSKGILGSEIVSQLLSEGAKVTGLDISSSANSKALYEHPNLNSIVCDISEPQEIAQAVNKACEKFGRIDSLHNNAATKTGDLGAFFAKTLEYSASTWDEVMAVNLRGMFLVARQVIGQMRAGSSILQTASIYGSTMGPDHRIYSGSEYLGIEISSPAVYTASKAGVHGLTVHLATEFGPSGIRVNTLSPGGIFSGQNSAFQNKYSDRIPLRRMARLDEVAKVALFLLSEESSYITGQNIFVDGGLSAI